MKILSIIVTSVFISCDSNFIPDPIDPRLPKYSNGGYNTAGALINHDVWISRSYTESYWDAGWGAPEWIEIFHNGSSIIADSTNNSLILHFFGLISTDSTTLEFHLTGLNINAINDFSYLKEQKIQLDGTANMGVCIRYRGTNDSTKYIKKGGVGQLYIKNVSVIDSLKSTTLSGTFGFSVNPSTADTFEVSYGRFDYTFVEGKNLEFE